MGIERVDCDGLYFMCFVFCYLFVTGEGIEEAFKEVADYLVEDEEADDNDHIRLGETRETSVEEKSSGCKCRTN